MTTIVSVDKETGELVPIAALENKLAQAQTPAETRRVIVEIDLLLQIAKSVGDSLEHINELQIPRIEAIRQAGRMLAVLERRQGARNDLTSASRLRKLSPYQEAYQESQISEQTARFWQNVAAIPDDTWDDYKDDCLMTGSEISLTGFVIYAKKGPHVSFNSGENEWYTPPKYIVAARRVMGGIDLDPASSAAANAVIEASTFYDMAMNGLDQDWAGRVWMNPPYSSDLIGPFMRKLRDEYEAGNVTQAITLTNNATETSWFQNVARLGVAVCFVKGRVPFWQPGGEDGAPLQGQALMYLGPNTDAFLREFASFGLVGELIERVK